MAATTNSTAVIAGLASQDIGGTGNDELAGGNGNDELTGSAGTDILTGGPGADTFSDLLSNIDGDTVTDFGVDDRFVLTGEELDIGAFTFTPGEDGANDFAVDADGDGTPDATVTVEGDFSDGEAMAVAAGGDTVVTFETYLPSLSDGVEVAAEDINGVNNQLFLTGDGAADFEVSLQDMGFAAYNNVLGVYEVTPGGEITDTRLLFDNTNADKTASTTITDVEDGHQLGFFIVQDAADWAAGLADTDTLAFVDMDGGTVEIADGGPAKLAVNGTDVEEIVYHSYATTLNGDGETHALSGVNPGGTSITLGFEDLTGTGDRDYEDVVFRVEALDMIA